MWPPVLLQAANLLCSKSWAPPLEPRRLIQPPAWPQTKARSLLRYQLHAMDRIACQEVKARDRYVYLAFGAETTAVLAVPLSSLRLRPGYVPQPKLRVTLRPAQGMPMELETTT